MDRDQGKLAPSKGFEAPTTAGAYTGSPGLYGYRLKPPLEKGSTWFGGRMSGIESGGIQAHEPGIMP